MFPEGISDHWMAQVSNRTLSDKGGAQVLKDLKFELNDKR